MVGRRLLNHIRVERLSLQWILDTHPHADHLSAAGYLKDKTGVPTGIGENIVKVQKLWKEFYNYPVSFRTDGSQWDRLFADGDRLKIGECEADVMFTPGHTLASIAYRVGYAVFVHDTLFQPDYGTDAQTSPVEMLAHFGRASSGSSLFPTIRECLRDTTTCPAVASLDGRAPSESSARKMCICRRQAPKTTS